MAMSTKIYFGVCIYLSVVHSIMSAGTSRLFSDNNKGSKNRNIRSPMCGGSNCGSFIKNTQKFLGPVTFNTYIKSSCGNESTCDNPGEPVVPNFKSGKFVIDFDTGSYGLDLYYLMDATFTFEDDRKILAGISEDFLTSVKKLSSDFQLGFGVYGDKNKKNSKTLQPESYGLWNKMPLTKDPANFSSIVKNTQTVQGPPSDNPAHPEEDALTGIHQVATCTSEINWRNNTLRMLLLATDENFKDARKDLQYKDKKPFDDTCKLDANGKLGGSEYTEINYPFVEQIRDVIKLNTIRVIFAVKTINGPSKEKIYEAVSKTIDPMPIVKTLQRNSENIIQVIEDAYSNATRVAGIETTLKGPKETVSKATVKSTCLSNGKSQDDPDSKIIDVEHCHVPKDGKLNLEIEVTLPCHLDTKKLHLTVNIQGYSHHREVDISKICN